MAYADIHRSSLTRFTQPFEAAVRSLAERYAAWRLYRTTLAELQALSARELADIDLHPSQITEIARQTAYGH